METITLLFLQALPSETLEQLGVIVEGCKFFMICMVPV